MRTIAFTAHGVAELIQIDDAMPLGPTEIRAQTIVSLTSPGTEINGAFFGSDFPRYPGYATVASVIELGAEVTDVSKGDIVLCAGLHREFVRSDARDVSKVPAGLLPEVAVFARLMGVGMTALNVMSANPPSQVLVTGLGPVGNLAAQVFAGCGFAVTAVDLLETRRNLARRCGLTDVRDSVSAPGPALKDQVRTHIECSGHEGAVLEGIEAVGRLGQVFLVGVPWRRATEITGHQILEAVFKRYVSVHSGWEWQVPRRVDSDRSNSIAQNYVAALEWLRTGRVTTEGLASMYRPEEAGRVYRGLADRTLPTIAALFDWRA